MCRPSCCDKFINEVKRLKVKVTGDENVARVQSFNVSVIKVLYYFKRLLTSNYASNDLHDPNIITIKHILYKFKQVSITTDTK